MKPFFIPLILLLPIFNALGLQPIPPDIYIQWQLICDLNNPPDDHGHGDIDYAFSVSLSEITNAQYAMFLNDVANTSDKHHLYHPKMAIQKTYDNHKKIYIYTPLIEDWNKPVTYIDTPTAMRYVNWLENGKPDTFKRPQDLDDATEKGTYELSKNISGLSHKIRKNDSRFALINLDEWIKAAYYDPIQKTYHSYIGGDKAPETAIMEKLNCCHTNTQLVDSHKLPSEGAYHIKGLSGNALEILEDYIPAGTAYKKYNDEANPAPTGGRFVRGSAYDIPESTIRSYLHRSHYKVRGECNDCRDHAHNTGFRIIYRYPTDLFCKNWDEEL